jgi:antagonist of KipI
MGEITILRASPLTTVQDLGRWHHRHAGIAASGALDLHAARVANLLVGNREESALLETTFGPTRLRFADERMIAWCGAECTARIGKTEVPPGRAARVFPGDELEIGAPRRGCRAWLAIAGEIDVPLVLGSRATDLRGEFGGLDGRALRDGDELPLAPFTSGLMISERIAPWSAPTEWTQTASRHPVLRVLPGTDWEEFAPGLLQEIYTVSAKADRMGARLTGRRLQRTNDVELISEGVAPGTIQVANDGQPILLLGDCQTIGGYPKIAHVITVDLPLAAQLRPNDEVRFQSVSAEEAREIFLIRENDLDRFRIGLRLRAS